MVEHTAHDGLVVGSNPTKLIFFIMELSTKFYKYYKFKSLFLTNDLVFFFNSSEESYLDTLKISRKFKVLKINNSLFNKVIYNSIFRGLSNFPGGSCLLGYYDNNSYIKLLVHNFKSFNGVLMCIVIKTNVYFINSVSNILSYKYSTNIYMFKITLIKHFKISTALSFLKT